MNRRTSLLPFASPLVLMLASCTVSSSSSSPAPNPPLHSSTLATNEMWASTSAQSDGQTIRVFAALLKGSDFVSLDEGDFFQATVGGDSVVLTREVEQNADGKVHYSANFPQAPGMATPVKLELLRVAGRAPAPSSTTVVPAPFEITSPAPSSVKRGSMLTVTIAPAPSITPAASNQERMALGFSGDCVADHGSYPVTFDASGTAVFDTSAIVLKDGATQGCDLHVQVRHEFDGAVDPAFSGSPPVEGLQARGFLTALVL